MRVDLFGVREGGTIDGKLARAAAARASRRCSRGQNYLLEAVIRTVKLGHPFTQGTADSNEVWLDVTVTSGDRVIGRSGGLDESGRGRSMVALRQRLHARPRRQPHRPPQPAGHLLAALQPPDPAGRGRRGALPARRCPPDADDADDGRGEAAVPQVRHRPTCSTSTATDYENDLPVHDARDRHASPSRSPAPRRPQTRSPTPRRRRSPEWQRWNDYGIGLLLKGGKRRASCGRPRRRSRRSRSSAAPTVR